MCISAIIIYVFLYIFRKYNQFIVNQQLAVTLFFVSVSKLWIYSYSLWDFKCTIYVLIQSLTSSRLKPIQITRRNSTLSDHAFNH